MPRQASHTRLSTSAEESQRTRPQRHEAAAHEDVLDAKAASPGARLLNGSVQGVTAPQELKGHLVLHLAVQHWILVHPSVKRVFLNRKHGA